MFTSVSGQRYKVKKKNMSHHQPANICYFGAKVLRSLRILRDTLINQQEQVFYVYIQIR